MLLYVTQLSVRGCTFYSVLKAASGSEAGVWENDVTCVRVPGVCVKILYESAAMLYETAPQSCQIESNADLVVLCVIVFETCILVKCLDKLRSRSPARTAS